MSIYVIETPHQGAPICWVADDEEMFIGLADSGTKRDGLREDATYAEARQYLSHDVQSLTIFDSSDDAAGYFLSGWNMGDFEDSEVLLRQLRYHIGEITDHETRLRIIAILWAERRDFEREIAGDAYDAIKAAAGSMTEVDIAEALGVNRMTVRRALGKL